MRASLYDLRTAYDACAAITWLYPEEGPTHLALDALATRIWQAILNREIANQEDARTAVMIARGLSDGDEGYIGSQGMRLLDNLGKWLADLP
ncbi:hypothetical protein BH10PSE1_BH10PSE1_28190 [soil metagenome]